LRQGSLNFGIAVIRHWRKPPPIEDLHSAMISWRHSAGNLSRWASATLPNAVAPTNAIIIHRISASQAGRFDHQSIGGALNRA
jgi:hypothetical protein